MKLLDMGRTKGTVRPIAPGTMVLHFNHEKTVLFDGPVADSRSELIDFGMTRGMQMSISCCPWKVAPAYGLDIPASDPRAAVSKPGNILSTSGDWLLTFDGEMIHMYKRKRDAVEAGLRLAAITDWHNAGAQAPAVTIEHTRLSVGTQFHQACEELGLSVEVGKQGYYRIGGGPPMSPRETAEYLIEGGWAAAYGASTLRIHPDRLAEAAARNSGEFVVDVEGFSEMLAAIGA